MRNIAILTGGDSAERVVSFKSSAVVMQQLSQHADYHCYQIEVEGVQWSDMATGIAIDKNDFSLSLPGGKVRFDAVFASLHGSPLEDGKLQGYFDLQGIPYTCCNGFTSAILMDKHLSKTMARPYGVPMANSVLLLKGKGYDSEALLSMGLPLFVKPNTHGSSFGVTKVKASIDLEAAIEEAFRFDTEIVVESFLNGREFSNGVFCLNGEIIALPITEIIPETEFFDFAAKYEGRSKEVTPAELTPAQTKECQERSVQLYRLFKCTGAVRFDYILHEGSFHFLEGNTIPGLTEASLLPQQAVSAGYPLPIFFRSLVEEAIKNALKLK